MIIETIDCVSDIGDGIANEDRAGASSSLVWVIDGATDVEDSWAFDSHRTGADWIADCIDKFFQTLPGPISAASAIQMAAQHVKESLDSLGFPDNGLPPACSCGVVALLDGHIEVAMVGDVFIYLFDEHRLISNPRFGQNEHNAVRESNGRGTFDDAARLGIAERRRKYIDGTGGAGTLVLSNNAGVLASLETARIYIGDDTKLLLATDGFARAVDGYHLYEDWGALATASCAIGLSHVVRNIRDFEEVNRTDQRNFKARDDVCALILRIER